MNTDSMNKPILLSAALAFGLVPAYAQNAASVKTNLDAQKSAKGAERMTLSPPKAVTRFVGGEVSYGGFLVDLAKANQPVKVLDARNPDKVKAGTDNIYTDPQTGKPRGFVLFAIKF